jgi:hypothetical protein
LTTSPAGTVAFGDVLVGKSVTETLKVTNNEPAGGALKLTKKIQPADAGFSVTGGSCTTINWLGGGKTCKYQFKLKGKKRNSGAVNANLLITGTFRPEVCPGHVQSVSVLLAGFVAEAAARINDSR